MKPLCRYCKKHQFKAIFLSTYLIYNYLFSTCILYYQRYGIRSKHNMRKGGLFLPPWLGSPPWQRGYVFGSVGLFVCLSVCLSVCGQHKSKRYERIGMKFYGGVLGNTMKN